MKRVHWVLAGIAVAALVFAVVNLRVRATADKPYARDHMEQVEQDVLGLAQQLGYTPATLLRQRQYKRDVSIIPPFQGKCVITMYFETPLTVDQFTERLNTVLPSAGGQGWKEENSSALFDNFDFAVWGGDSAGAQTFLQYRSVAAYRWAPFSKEGTIILYDIKNLPVTLIYQGWPVKGNIARINIVGGEFPTQVDCPAKQVERQRSS